MTDPMKFATHLAIQTGNLLRKFYNPAGLAASHKADHTIVTQADLAADRLVSDTIHKSFPSDEIITEESSHQVIDVRNPCWVIDPLDGTTNFSLGLTIWGVSIARLVDGSPQLGAIYFPLINELYTASRGQGAFLNHNSISTRAPDPKQPMSFFACCSRTFRNYTVDIPYKPRILGSAAYSFCLVARGAALLGFDATPKIWDLAAAWLLVEEAGGKITAFEGPNPFPIARTDDFSKVHYPTLAAATLEVFASGQKKIQRKSKFALVIQDKT
ncbi:MAG TPA: inositol monophosphatase family protein [Anaerolineales bacterium]